uniref:Uncharacterized protein n=1 Tax=Anguilla anguilla TaxID=7936 RepID=A0A0E9PUT2_ANGAN
MLQVCATRFISMYHN